MAELERVLTKIESERASAKAAGDQDRLGRLAKLAASIMGIMDLKQDLKKEIEHGYSANEDQPDHSE